MLSINGERGLHLFNLFSLFVFLFILLPSCQSPINSEGLYQLGVQRCPPQSSIEGLEDTEVGSNSLPAYLPAAEDIAEDYRSISEANRSNPSLPPL